LLLTVFANSSCQRNGSKKQNNPAFELYCKYADSTNLTVAYLSDFQVHGNEINTVMIQAEDEDVWEQLLNEFALSQQVVKEITGNTMPDPSYSVEVGLKWDTRFVMSDDVFTKEHLDDEEIEIFAQAIVNEFSTALNSLLESDSDVHNASIIINDDINFMSDMSFGMEFKDTTAVKRILQAVADMLNNNGLAYNDMILNTETTFEQINHPSSIMPDAQQHGEDGYIAAVDYINFTLWIFFYDNAEESANIMKHIRKDLLVFQKF
jgi:hypothetical protein